VREEEMEALVATRGRSGPFRGVADLASRAGAGRDGLERLAWAGVLDCIPLGDGSRPPAEGAGRREALWRVGGAPVGRRSAGHVQPALPLEPSSSPPLEPLGDGERTIADYRSTGMALGEHPMGLMRPDLGPELLRSNDLRRAADGSEVEVGGMVVARQRPETAHGIVFMLLEDERGTINLIVPPPVYERYRAVVRAAPLVRARGRLERREGTVNVLVAALAELERPPPARPRPEVARIRRRAVAELRAVAPAGHSFGRRGR
jgi:error-prone DNA polymerase